MKYLIVLTSLLCLVHVQGSFTRACVKTGRNIPSAHKRPMTTVDSQVCNMFDKTCCGFTAEAEMKTMANNDFTKKLLLVKKSLQSVSDPMVISQLTPDVFSPDFNAKIQSAGDVTLQELARIAVSAYVKDTCEDEIDSLAWEVSSDVKSVANNLAALYNGITTIKSALEIILEYKISDDCVKALMTNGIPIRVDFKHSMCQACTRDTFDYVTCKNTCRNTVQGCYNELTGITTGLDRLALNLDKVYYKLRQDIGTPEGALNQVEQKIQQKFEDMSFKKRCSKGTEPAFVEVESLAQPADFSGKPLDLKSIMVRSVDLHCIKSRTEKECWTANGFGDDDQSVLQFTSEDQFKNTILRKQVSASVKVTDEETKLRNAIEKATVAQTTADLFREEEQPVAPTEPKPEPTEPKEDETEDTDDMEDDKSEEGTEEKDKEDMEEKDEEDMEGEKEKEDDEADDKTVGEKEADSSEDDKEGDDKDMEKENEEEETNDTEDGDGYEVGDQEDDLDTNAVEGKATGSDKNSSTVSSISYLILSMILLRLTA